MSSDQRRFQLYKNPYRPGAGHMPPYLAGRKSEREEFSRLLEQDTVLENMVLTGLRGVGKTVLLETLKPLALERGWRWAGTDLSETASVSEHNLALRLITDLSVITSGIVVTAPAKQQTGFTSAPPADDRKVPLTYDVLLAAYQNAPGLTADKIKAVLEFAWHHMRPQQRNRVIFAYDEAQNLSDNARRDEYPLSVMLDVFQSIQRKGIPFMLVLTGLPTLLPKLVEARTYAERMFHVVTIGRLADDDSRDAILAPLNRDEFPIRFNTGSVDMIVEESGGYPYFIQFLCREVYDIWIAHLGSTEVPTAPMGPIQLKLDQDFFTGRWSKVTDRQRQLLWVIATLERGDDEFTIQEVVSRSRALLPKGFSASHTSQMLASLAEQGLIYKNRFGKYTFAVPLLGKFILRTYDPPSALELPA